MHIFWKIQWYHQKQDYPSFWIFNIFIHEYIYNFFVFKLVIKRLVIDGCIFFFTEWSYSGSFCEKFDNLGWKKLLMAFCLGILCKNVHLFNVFSLILFIQIVSILRAQSSIINNTEESNPITTSKSCYICLRGVIKWEY